MPGHGAYGYGFDPERPRDPAAPVGQREATVVHDLFAWFVDEGVWSASCATPALSFIVRPGHSTALSAVRAY